MTVESVLQQAREVGVEVRLVDGRIKAVGTRAAVALVLEPLRQHKADLIRWFTWAPANDPEQPMDRSAWRELAAAYHAHHWTCRTCCTAGQGRGLRCGVGAALWREYTG